MTFFFDAFISEFEQVADIVLFFSIVEFEQVYAGWDKVEREVGDGSQTLTLLHWRKLHR